jgi:hypothetical protein
MRLLALLLLAAAAPARAQEAPDLRALARPRPVAELIPSYAEVQKDRLRRDLLPQPGHRVVTDAPARRDPADDIRRRSFPGRRVETETVELSFLRPAPGLTAGVGVSDRREWLGPWRSPEDRSKFGFVRFQLNMPRPSHPVLFLPEARVTHAELADRYRQSVEEHSVRDLPRP